MTFYIGVAIVVGLVAFYVSLVGTVHDESLRDTQSPGELWVVGVVLSAVAAVMAGALWPAVVLFGGLYWVVKLAHTRHCSICSRKEQPHDPR